MRILSQAEQFPLRTAALNFTPMEDNLHWAKGEHSNYLIDSPTPAGSPRGVGRPGTPEAFLLHTRPTGLDDSLGQPPRVWDFHSAHPSMESAVAAAERHHAGGG